MAETSGGPQHHCWWNARKTKCVIPVKMAAYNWRSSHVCNSRLLWVLSSASAFASKRKFVSVDTEHSKKLADPSASAFTHLWSARPALAYLCALCVDHLRLRSVPALLSQRPPSYVKIADSYAQSPGVLHFWTSNLEHLVIWAAPPICFFRLFQPFMYSLLAHFTHHHGRHCDDAYVL